MDALLQGFGMLIWMAVFFGILAYGLRNRGRVLKWLRNDNADNAEFDEKENKKVELQREKEDIERELAKLNKTETGE